MDERGERLKTAFDPARFAEAGHALVDSVRDYFTQSLAGSPTWPWKTPPEMVARAKRLIDSRPGFETLVAEILSETRRLHSPHYMGHQVPPALPAAGLFDALASLTNQGLGLYEMSPFFTAAERALVEKLCGAIGWDTASADGIGTSGGTLANLTAVLSARNRRYGDAWEEGLAGRDRRPAILVGEDAHYSLARAAGILGLGTSAVWKVPGDARRKMRPEAARRVLEAARAKGHDVFCLVGSACSTPIGAYDDLLGLAALCRDEGLWFHVDGAHGASALMTRRYRALLDGIESADSVTWDAHKMLFVPSLSTFLLYRDGKRSFEAFRQDAPYLFDPGASGMSAYDGALRTVECTRHALSASLFGAWALHGETLFEDLVETTYDLARALHRLLVSTPDFEPLHEPEANILCFRHVPEAVRGAGKETVSRLQQALRRELVRRGNLYITGTRLDGEQVLRVTLMNPFTEASHLSACLAELRAIGAELLGRPGAAGVFHEPRRTVTPSDPSTAGPGPRDRLPN